MSKLPPPPKPRRISFFQREDWMISAGLVLVIYVVILVLLYHFLHGPSLMKYLIHALPVIAMVMVWKGIGDRDRQLDRERLIRTQRRRAEHLLANQDKPKSSPPISEGKEDKK